MNRPLLYLLVTTLFMGSQLPSAFGQATDKIVYGGVNLAHGAGRYNGLNAGVGVSGRFQYPLTRTVALTAKVGVDIYQISYLFVNFNSLPGYGYSPITGWCYNTHYIYPYGYEYKTTGVSIPLNFGPRIYLTKQVHADLNVGVNIAATESMVSVLHVEPGAGYTLPLRGGGLLDLTTSYFTSFASGSGVFTLGVAYGLKINR